MTRLVLDTNVVIWLLTGERSALSSAAVRALDDTEELLVSAACVWEIAIKRSLGRLDLGADWLAQLGSLDFAHLPISAAHAARVERLPWHHRDPFDRLLVAQAQAESCPIVSSDAVLIDYGVQVIW